MIAATSARLVAGLVLVLLEVSACAPQPAPPASGRSADIAPAPPRQRKTLTVALQAEISGLATGINEVGANSGASRYFHEFADAYLTTHDAHDEVRPWLARDLPSIQAGMWKILDDGQMEVTWTLRDGVTWHDGQPLTSDDVKFGWEAAKEPSAQVRAQGVAGEITAVDTPDPRTAVFRWGHVSNLAGDLNVNAFDVLPRHVLGEALLADKDSFSTNPYFSAPEQFVGSGPFRPVSWDRGSEITVEAYDGYFLGRPKIDRVIFKFIRDAQTALANLLSGSVDVSYQSVGFQQALTIRDEWSKSGGGSVEMQLNHTRHLLPQLRPEYAAPGDLLNVQVRRALMHAMDRSDIAESVLPGAGQPADSMTHPDTAIGKATAQRVVAYPHDPARAEALFEETGWLRGPDGMLQKNGEKFTLEYRTSGAAVDATNLFPVLQQQWRDAGVDAQFKEVATTNTPTDTALYPGVWFTSLAPDSTSVLARFSSGQIAAPENRYFGGNRNAYSSPTADRILAQIDASLTTADRATNWAELFHVLSEDAAYFPLYYQLTPYVVRKGVTGALPANQLNPPSHFAHTWDIE